MRTTAVFDDDVAAAIDRLRRDRSVGMSEAVNDLIRAGLRAPAPKAAFTQRTHALGLQIDPTDVADALEILEGPASR